MRKKKIYNVHSGLFFRGTMNNWNLDNEFEQIAENTYVARNIKISKGLNEFKIADANWSNNATYSYCGDVPVMLYHNYSLTTNNDSSNAVMVAHSDYVVDVFVKNIDNNLVMRMKVHSEKN